nr:site-2 protease family protein [Lipingzhangella halophila]
MTDHGSASPPSRRGADEAPSGGRGPGLLIGRPFGIPVYVSPSWLVIAAIITVLYEPVVERTLALGLPSYLVAFAFAVLLYVSVLVHELAHSVMARMYQLPVRRITLYMLGGYSEIEREAPTPGREFGIVFAGPLLSLALAGIGFVSYAFVDPYTITGVLIQQLWVANLLVGVFNLLPGLPLDGGRLVRAAVWWLTRRPTAGTVVAAWSGRGLAVAVVALPFLWAWSQERPPNEFAVLWAVLLASFMWIGAGRALRNARLRERLPRLRANQLARPAVTVPADTSVAEARRRMDAAGAGAILVVDTAGTATSIVNEDAALAVPDERRPWVPASSVARAISSGAVLAPELEGEQLLEAMRGTPAPEYLVAPDDSGGRSVLRTADVNAALTRG